MLNEILKKFDEEFPDLYRKIVSNYVLSTGNGITNLIESPCGFMMKRFLRQAMLDYARSIVLEEKEKFNCCSTCDELYELCCKNILSHIQQDEDLTK